MFRLRAPAAGAVLLISLAGGRVPAQPPLTGAPVAARDAAVVESLLRLPGVDVNGNPKLKAAVARYLEAHRTTPRYLELVERFQWRDANPELLRLTLADPSGTLGVRAVELLLQQDGGALLADTLAGEDEPAALAAITALGSLGGQTATEVLNRVVCEPQRPVTRRVAAVQALSRTRPGANRLLALARDGQLAAELKFAAADALHASRDPAVREQAAQYLERPTTADQTPLPPLAELAGRTGDPYRGRNVFLTTGTCTQCHLLGGEGKEVGPSLAEIGGKLSKEALYTSILDPSAGIAQSYETYALALTDGNVLSGILVSQTESTVTIRTAEAIVREIPRTSIEELQKQAISLMPSDLQKNLSEQQLVDLVEFLGTLRHADGTTPADPATAHAP